MAERISCSVVSGANICIGLCSSGKASRCFRGATLVSLEHAAFMSYGTGFRAFKHVCDCFG
ncbi:hypothetical protein [Rubritalea tangerina]|uniref:hypothetical protein n=1 Tax=Rubritalea tangerina TaxID=430798 RepID=UPI003617C3F4